jgi:hypothetical protein
MLSCCSILTSKLMRKETLAGVPNGFKLQNRTLMIGVALLAAGIALYCWTETTFGPDYADDKTTGGFRWGNVFLALVFSAVCILASRFAYLGR